MGIPVRLHSAETGGAWLAAETQAGETGEPASRGARERIEAFLIDCLTSHNLVVLAGLGASLSLNTLNKATPTQQPAPTMADLWRMAKESGNSFLRVLEAVSYNPPEGNESIETLLSRCKMALELWPKDHEDRSMLVRFAAETENIIRDQCNFIRDTTALDIHETFLQRIGRRSSRSPRTKIFTTNYDRCFEEAARRLRFVVVDGFSHAMPQTYDPGYFSYDIVRREQGREGPEYIENVFQLYKLHGSVDWTREGGEIIKREGTDKPLLIYPRSSKYEQAFEPPYLDMMAAFQASLRQPDTALVVVGFGFNDDHVARPIMGALQANLSFRLLVCDPRFVQSTDDGTQYALKVDFPSNKYHWQMMQLIDAKDGRVALVRGGFEDLVRYMPDLVAENDRERHAQRFRQLRELEDILW